MRNVISAAARAGVKQIATTRPCVPIAATQARAFSTTRRRLKPRSATPACPSPFFGRRGICKTCSPPSPGWTRDVQHAVAGGHGLGSDGRRRRGASTVALIALGATNRAFDIHQPGGVSAAAICRAVQSVTGREIGYQESTSGTRAAVESYPISDVHKESYAELYDYFKSETFLGDPLEMIDTIPGFTYGTIEDFVRRNLYPATAPAIALPHTEDAAMIVMAIRHKVRDFDAWKTVYDTFPPTAAGARFARVNRATDDANDVLIVSGWNALTDAQAFKSNPELGEKMVAAGVLGVPRFEVYEQVEVLGG